MSKRSLRNFGFEQLEGRRLLAADFGMQVVQLPALPAEVCMAVEVIEAEQVDDAFDELITDQDSGAETVVEDESTKTGIDGVEPGGADSEAEVEAAIEEEVESESEVEVEAEVEAEVEVENGNELRDPVTGTSGYFGVIDAESPMKAITFSPSQSGTVDVVTASSFGDSETRIEVTNSNGDLIAASMTEDLEGFQKLTFEVEANDGYQLEVSSDEAGEGYFMVTVEFSEAAETVEEAPIDFHSDEIGDSATELTVENGAFEIASELETEDDRDAFRFVAPATGEVTLEMKTASDNHQADAVVSVFDSEGELIVEGSTNEEVLIRFDTTEGVEYHLLVDASNDTKAAFELAGTLFPESLNEESGELLSGEEIGAGSELSEVIEEEIVFCEDPADANEPVIENEVVDDLFEELGAEIAAEVRPTNRFFGHDHGLWFGWF